MENNDKETKELAMATYTSQKLFIMGTLLSTAKLLKQQLRQLNNAAILIDPHLKENHKHSTKVKKKKLNPNTNLPSKP